MTLLLKDPQAILDYAIDWGAEYLVPGDLIAASEWSVVPDDADGIASIELRQLGEWAASRPAQASINL